MRADFLLKSGVLTLLLTLGACSTGSPSGPDGAGDAGVLVDGGSGGGTTDAGTPTPGESGCDVEKQQGCATGETCLRGQLGDGGQGNVCFPGECDAVAQNCAAGSRCTYVTGADNRTTRRCVPASTGGVAEGGGCTSVSTSDGDFYDTCQAGLACTSSPTASGGSAPYTCKRFCYGAAQCKAPSDCVEVVGFTGSSELPRVCGAPGSSCDVLAPGSGCASPRGCYPSPQSGGVCVTAGTRVTGQGCTYSNDCVPGDACVAAGAGRVCRTLCRSPSGSPACTSGRCEPLQDFSGVGVCVP